MKKQKKLGKGMNEQKRRYKELCEKSRDGESLSREELTERVKLYYEISGRERVDFSDVETVDYQVD